jgi:hypothetical protein
MMDQASLPKLDGLYRNEIFLVLKIENIFVVFIFFIITNYTSNVYLCKK